MADRRKKRSKKRCKIPTIKTNEETVDDAGWIEDDYNEEIPKELDILSQILDRFSTELKLTLLNYLKPLDVYKLLFVNRSFNRLASTQEYWWNLCKNLSLDTHTSKKMSRTEKRVDWKSKYIYLVGFKPTEFKPKKIWTPRVFDAPPELTQSEMRSYYKSIRSKPKHKDHRRHLMQEDVIYQPLF